MGVLKDIQNGDFCCGLYIVFICNENGLEKFRCALVFQTNKLHMSASLLNNRTFQ